MKKLLLIVALILPGTAWAEAWVLLLPPRVNTKEGRVTDTNAPIKQWAEQSSYDTARECQAAKRQAAESARGSSLDWYFWFDSARCVPYDLWWKAQEPAR